MIMQELPRYGPLDDAKKAVFMAEDVSVQHNKIGLIEKQYRDGEDIDDSNSIQLDYFGIYEHGLTYEEKQNIAVIVANLATAYLNKKQRTGDINVLLKNGGVV